MNKDNKIQEPIEEINEYVTDLTMDQLIPNTFDNYGVGIIDDHHTILMPMNITGTQFRAWKKSKGGIFSKDVLKYSLGKDCGKYVHIQSKELTCIARLIDDEEELTFRTLKLIDGKIKDVPYMILRKIKNEQKFINSQRYIDENNDISEDEEMYISSISTKLSQDDDFDHPSRSISLFSE